MELIITFLLVLTLGIITYQDFKSRMIYWILFPIGIVLGTLYGLFQTDTMEYLLTVGSNLVFIVLFLIIPLSFFMLKSGSLSALFDRYLGLGDVLMFLLLCFCFSISNLFLFIVSSLCLILLFYGFLHLLRIRVRTIPLAGLLSLFTIFVLVIDSIGSSIELLNNDIGFGITNAIISLI